MPSSNASTLLTLPTEIQQLIIRQLLDPLIDETLKRYSTSQPSEPQPLLSQVQTLFLVSRTFAVLSLDPVCTSPPGRLTLLGMFENLLQLEERDFEWETDRWESMIRTGCWEDGEGNKEEEFARMKADVEVLRGQVGRLTGWIRVVEGWAATDPAGGAG